MNRIFNSKRLLLAIILLILLTGVIYEHTSSKSLQAKYPAPGKIVDIGNHKMHINCAGTGSPTVVFESGMDSYGSMSWNRMLSRVSNYTRACSYDRSGIMWSESRLSNEEFSNRVIDELNSLLADSAEPAPYLLVGHSLGGAYVTLFASKHSELVAGVVLLDSSHPDLESNLAGHISDGWIEDLEDTLLVSFEPILRNSGILRFVSRYTKHHEPEVDWSNSELEIIEGFRPKSFLALQSEVKALSETLHQLGLNRNIGDIPLTVVDAHLDASTIPDSELRMIGLSRKSLESIFEGQAQMHRDKANWSSNSELLTLENTRHYVQFQSPDKVDSIIKSMVTDYRGRNGN